MALNAVAEFGYFHQLGLMLTTVASRVTLLRQLCMHSNPQLLWLSNLRSVYEPVASLLICLRLIHVFFICWTALSMLSLSELEVTSSRPVAVHVLSVYAQGT